MYSETAPFMINVYLTDPKHTHIISPLTLIAITLVSTSLLFILKLSYCHFLNYCCCFVAWFYGWLLSLLKIR